MENKNISPVLLTYGGAEKSSFDMTAEEFKIASVSILNRAKEKAFSKGLPIYYGRNGDVIAEYADGHTEIVS
jgi:hypothetical protein